MCVCVCMCVHVIFLGLGIFGAIICFFGGGVKICGICAHHVTVLENRKVGVHTWLHTYRLD